MPSILIVDDEKENLEALCRALGDENGDWKIFTANNEKIAEDILRKQLESKTPIDVLLTDLVMENEASGMSLLQRARALDPLLMMILFTAKEKSLDRYAAFDFGAFDVVEKNIRGTSAVREINIKTRAAIQYRQWSQKINFMRKYFDPKVFELLDKQPHLLDLSRKTLTITFWDIRGFSKLCESLKGHPILISGFLTEYCEMCATTIFRNNGVLDKFIGDGVMALFGVLSKDDTDGTEDAISAIRAALEIRREFNSLLERWLDKWKLYVPDKIEIGIGCGVHTGEVLVGNVGTDFRDQFTALGTQVNFASRIEGRSKHNQIIVSQSTALRAEKHFTVVPAGEISDIKNIPGTFPLYEVE